MNIWFRRFLVVLTVGGGFLGVVIGADTLFAAKNTPAFGYAMIALVTALYSYGIFAGIRLSEDASHYGHVLIFMRCKFRSFHHRSCFIVLPADFTRRSG
jgi:hypothetical protein